MVHRLHSTRDGVIDGGGVPRRIKTARVIESVKGKRRPKVVSTSTTRGMDTRRCRGTAATPGTPRTGTIRGIGVALGGGRHAPVRHGHGRRAAIPLVHGEIGVDGEGWRRGWMGMGIVHADRSG